MVGADDVAQPRQVQTLRTVGNTWLVGEGLQGGERVVTEGLQRLRPGMPVQAEEARNVNIVTQFGAARGQG